MFYVSETPFHFVVPSGRRGSDYDMEVYNDQRHLACVSAKCKIETTDMSMASIMNTLNGARDQLPSNVPSMIFVRVPHEWVGDDFRMTPFGNVVTEFLRGTKRIVSVTIYFMDIWKDAEHMADVILLKSFSNPNHRFDPAIDWDLLRADNTISSRWTQFINIVTDVMGPPA
jgi:hypothetical protein